MAANVHAMVDLETLDVKATGVIMSIGAVAFDPMGTEMGERFYTVISIDDCLKHGLTTSPDTLKWWLKQSPEAQSVMHEAKASNKTLEDALSAFSVWWKANKLKYLWGNGAAFDNAMLSYAYTRTNIDQPWVCWNDLCFRTLKNLNSEVPATPRHGTYHNALDDAITQAYWCQAIFNSWQQE